MDKLLIVIDFQKDFIGGVLGIPEAQAIVPKVKEKVNWYIKNGYPVIFTRYAQNKRTYYQFTGSKKIPRCCIEKSYGWNIGLEVIPGTYRIIDKQTFGYSSWQHIIDEYIYGINFHIEICGLNTDVSVITNTLSIKTIYPDIEITVDSTCCAGSTPEKHLAALEVMKSCGINILE